MSADSSGNGHRFNTIRPSIPQRAFGGGGLWGHKLKTAKESCQTTGPIGTKFGMYTFVDSSGNGHRLKTICPTVPQGGIWGGGLGGQQFKRLGNVVKRLDRFGINLAPVQMNLGMDTG